MARLEEEDSGISVGKLVAFAAIFIIVSVVILGTIVLIPTGAVGIKMEFGKAVGSLDEGINFVIPMVNSVELMDLRLQKHEAKANAASSDLQIVDTAVTVNFQIEKGSALELYRKMRNEYTIRLIEPVVQEAVKANTAKFSAEELITKRDQVKIAIEAQLRNKLGQYGIIVKEVSITNFDFSEQFDMAIEQKVVAQQNALRANAELQQRTIEAQTQVVQANASAQAAILRADGEAQSILIRAQAESEAIKKINSALTPDYLKYYGVERWDGKLPLFVGQQDGLIVDTSSLVNKGE